MTKYESLLAESKRQIIIVHENYDLTGTRIQGLYCDNSVVLSNELNTSAEKSCVLTEELGHYYTTVCNIICQSSAANRKQEHRARIWAYEKIVGLMGIVKSYQRGCATLYEMAEYLEVTEEFLTEALQYYKSKYGVCTTIDNYVIYFEPSLGVFELI